jgi:hypothetical protein
MEIEVEHPALHRKRKLLATEVGEVLVRSAYVFFLYLVFCKL